MSTLPKTAHSTTQPTSSISTLAVRRNDGDTGRSCSASAAGKKAASSSLSTGPPNAARWRQLCRSTWP
ncbi:hypothetical protein JAB2_54130 [Janthinobacterium sp. HH100]|nr:hypothetical protein JAB2_54130 [Janthinobacterium sp. HH100]